MAVRAERQLEGKPGTNSLTSIDGKLRPGTPVLLMASTLRPAAGTLVTDTDGHCPGPERVFGCKAGAMYHLLSDGLLAGIGVWNRPPTLQQ